MVKPKIIYLLETENEDLFAVEFYGAKENETFLLLCQPPFGQFEDLSGAHESWHQSGMQIIQLPREYLDFQASDFEYLDESADAYIFRFMTSNKNYERSYLAKYMKPKLPIEMTVAAKMDNSDMAFLVIKQIGGTESTTIKSGSYFEGRRLPDRM